MSVSSLQQWKAKILANEEVHNRIFLPERRLFNKQVMLSGGGGSGGKRAKRIPRPRSGSPGAKMTRKLRKQQRNKPRAEQRQLYRKWKKLLRK